MNAMQNILTERMFHSVLKRCVYGGATGGPSRTLVVTFPDVVLKLCS